VSKHKNCFSTQERDRDNTQDQRQEPLFIARQHLRPTHKTKNKYHSARDQEQSKQKNKDKDRFSVQDKNKTKHRSKKKHYFSAQDKNKTKDRNKDK
tara:strand:- start:91 stop:378 length:288 start_codon:yes stop_codon:yes gene_type:complete